MVCDKCGLPVARSDDAVVIASYAENAPMMLLVYRARHFMPSETCPGSPSRAQYIAGQPRDTRGYRYDTAQETRYRQAYARVLVAGHSND